MAYQNQEKCIKCSKSIPAFPEDASSEELHCDKSYEAIEQAEALGFNSAEEMMEHQDWLKRKAERVSKAREAVKEAKRANTDIVDVRNLV